MKNTNETQQKIIACDLTKLSENERKNLIANSNKIFSNVDTVKELEDGYAVVFSNATPELIKKLAEFIAYDRICCSFIKHAIISEPDNLNVRLQLTGGGEVKKYIKMELDNIL